jgi:hypothetical protein
MSKGKSRKHRFSQPQGGRLDFPKSSLRKIPAEGSIEAAYNAAMFGKERPTMMIGRLGGLIQKRGGRPGLR